MYDYHLNFFRPYRHDCRNEMSVTRALMITCAKSHQGNDFLEKIMRKAGFNASLSNINPLLGLEVSGGSSWVGESYIKKIVLCISPDEAIIQDGVLSSLYTSGHDALKKFSHIVLIDADQPDLEKFKKKLIEAYPDINNSLIGKDETEVEALLKNAYWDIWRLFYAGARVDAVIKTTDMLCLIESKIWGGVYEVQIRNHAQEFFGTANVPIHAVSWQSIYDTAKTYTDPIIADFAEYLSEFPQLVRWNGFDTLDVKAFAMNAGLLKAEPVLQNRLASRYWQSMEELCKHFDYIVLARRGDDWDFNPRDLTLIGNTGIGYWGGGMLSVKWCVGYHAWEMDAIMSKHDLMQRGEIACGKLSEDLTASGFIQGLRVEMRAVQRFQYANAQDGTWFDGSSYSMADEGNAAEAISTIWRKELDILNQFNARRGLEVTSTEALAIKKDVFIARHPDSHDLPTGMRTRHETWKLFAALDIFVHIDPKVFSTAYVGEGPTKTEQLAEMDIIVKALALFAETISK
jgi:hypothetical protein